MPKLTDSRYDRKEEKVNEELHDLILVTIVLV
jgi:hypothetical protein